MAYYNQHDLVEEIVAFKPEYVGRQNEEEMDGQFTILNRFKKDSIKWNRKFQLYFLKNKGDKLIGREEIAFSLKKCLILTSNSLNSIFSTNGSGNSISADNGDDSKSSFTVSTENNVGKCSPLIFNVCSPNDEGEISIAKDKLNYSSICNKNSKVNPIQEKINIFYLFSNYKFNRINLRRMSNNKSIDISSKSNQKLSYVWKYGQTNSLFCIKAKNRSLTYFHETFKFDLLNNGSIDNYSPLPRSGHRIVCDEHYVYLFGGFNPHLLPNAPVPNVRIWNESKPLLKELWRYSKLTQTWQYLSTTGTAPNALASHCAIMIGPNRLLVYGGSGTPFGLANSNKMYICDLIRLHWKRINFENEMVYSDNNLFAYNPDIPIPAYGQAIVYDNKKELIYICGGTTGFDYFLDMHEFNLKTNCWRLLSPAPENIEPRYRHEMVLYKEKLYIIGGSTVEQSFSLHQIPVFDLTEKKWSLIETKASKIRERRYPAPRSSHSCVQFGKMVYIVGGLDIETAHNDFWSLNLETLQWNEHISLPMPCYFHSAAQNDSEMFVFGGMNDVTRKVRNNVMYRCWVGVPTLQRMSQEAIMKNLQNIAQTKITINHIRNYFNSMQINADMLKLPNF